jgi:hypothetical protein
MGTVRCVLRWCLIAATGLASSAQTLVDAARIPERLKNFEPEPGEKRLRCNVVPLKPMLNFGFRFEAGYVVRVPMEQYSGPGHAWAFLARITPAGGEKAPVYLVGRTRLPNVPQTKVVWEAGGAWLLGEGRYHVSWKLFDDSGRVCRKDWNIDARLGRGERRIRMAMAPGTVADISLRGAARHRNTDDAAPVRLTVFLHAAPISPRRTYMGPRDRIMLLGALSAVLERVPVRSIKLVAFNLEQQKELYRRDGFAPESLGEVAQSLAALQLDTVDYRILQRPTGHLDLLADLVNEELRSQTRAEVVLFLGPLARFTDKVPNRDLGSQREGPLPRFLYLQYRPLLRYPEAALGDSIQRAVSALKGRTVVVRSPGDLAKAIEMVEGK